MSSARLDWGDRFPGKTAVEASTLARAELDKIEAQFYVTSSRIQIYPRKVLDDDDQPEKVWEAYATAEGWI